MESNDHDLNPSNYWIDNSKILNEQRFSSVTKDLIVKLKTNPYLTLQQFFEQLSDQDLMILVKKVHNDDDEELLLLSELLIRAEGLISESIDQMIENIRKFRIFIAAEHLARHDMIVFHREWLTFGEENLDRLIITLKDKSDDVDPSS